MRYTFEWDALKAKENSRKHGVTFERGAEVFLDPLAISLVDHEHSETEERWVTIGVDAHGSVVVIIHTFLEAARDECRIRMISARKATRKEIRQYRELVL